MEREVIIGNATFIVNSYSSRDATESVEEILKRVILKNAEAAFKSRPFIGSFEAGDSHGN